VTEVCPNCGRGLPGAFPFCPFCGASLAATPSPREERKVVTVLFCDLVGSTARAERLDPEDVRALLSNYHGRVRAELERFGGTVEKLIGDAVVAVFGAPVAHEDDPERAVRAALAIREWMGDETDLKVRIGVNTGPALVTLDARPEAGEAMASGDVVNTAARLQTAAPVDGILVGEQAYRATNRVIDYRAADPVSAKGKSEPVLVWEAVEARSRLGVDVTRTHSAPLVGRTRELELLVDLLERVSVERVPQLVTLVGVPGIGKSRLLAELIERIEMGGRLVTWRQGRSLPYGVGVSFWALGEITKAQAGVLESDSAEEAARKVDGAVARSIPDEAEARWVASHLHPLVGVAAATPASDERRSESFAAWRRFVEALGEERPLILVFEDIHWADDGLLDFVDELVDRLADVPVLIVAVTRPELLARRPAWGGGKANAFTISLAPLTEEETGHLVDALRERSALAPETQAALLEHAGGNPLYAEEFVRMLADQGAAGTQLPESVHGIIAARLDGLSPEDKSLLQDAAVLGKLFWPGALAHITTLDRNEIEGRLHELERRELVRRERRSSLAGELEYAFRHVLVRDVAYETVPRAARAEKHVRAAQWIESMGRLDDRADELAHHYLSAVELARAAGSDAGIHAGDAAAALVRAGDRAYGLGAFESAARFYREALGLGVSEHERPHLLLSLGSAQHFSGDPNAVEALEEALETLIAVDDLEAAAEAGAVLSGAWWYLSHGDRARETIEQAQRLVAGRSDSYAAARVLAQASRLATVQSRYDDALQLGIDALRMQRALGIERLVPDPAGTVATARAMTGDLDRGLCELEEVVERAARVGSPEAVRSCNNLAILLWHAGDLERAEDVTRAGIRLAERLGHRMHFLDGHLRWLGFQRGRWDEALATSDAFLANSSGGAVRYGEGTALRVRARIYLARDIPSAETEARKQLELSRTSGDPQSLVPALSTAAYVYLELGHTADAQDAISEMLPILAAGMLTAHVTAWPVLADPALRTSIRTALLEAPRTPLVDVARRLAEGDVPGAADRLATQGDISSAAELRLCAARQLATEGHERERDEQLAKALPFFHSVGASRFIRECNALAS
jgi:class 3 adenylate cyclase/tetratricopeptide (TPR) repeat protein